MRSSGDVSAGVDDAVRVGSRDPVHLYRVRGRGGRTPLLGRRSDWTWRRGDNTGLGALLAARLNWLKAPVHLPRWGNVVAWCCLAVYLLAVSAFSTQIAVDVAWLALGISLLLAVALARLLPVEMGTRLATARCS